MDELIFGEEFTFLTSRANVPSVVALSPTQAIVAYQDYDNSQYGTAVVATIDGSGISFGTPLVVLNDGITTSPAIVKINASSVLFMGGDVTSGDGHAKVLTVDGTTLTAGSRYRFIDSVNRPTFTTVLEVEPNKFLAVYRAENGVTDDGNIQILETSGTIITYGTPVAILSTIATNCDIAIIDSTYFVVVFRKSTGVKDGIIYAGKITGNSVSVTTPVTFDTDGAGGVGNGLKVDVISRSYGDPIPGLDTHKVLIYWSDNGSANAAAARVAEIVVGGGSPTVSPFINSTYSPGGVIGSLNSNARGMGKIDTDRFLALFEDTSDSGHGTAMILNVNDNDVITPTGETEFKPDGEVWGPGFSTLDDYGKQIIVYRDDSDSLYGKAKILYVSGVVPLVFDETDLVMNPGGHIKFASSWYPENWNDRNG